MAGAQHEIRIHNGRWLLSLQRDQIPHHELLEELLVKYGRFAPQFAV